MPDISERAFVDNVLLPVLDAHFEDPGFDVTQEVYVREPDGFIDVVVDLGVLALTIEATNDPTPSKDAAQAIEYASHYPGGVPIVAAPDGALDGPAVGVWDGWGVTFWAVDTGTGQITVGGGSDDD